MNELGTWFLAIAATVLGGLALWLVQGRIERTESDLKELNDAKVDRVTCKVLHEEIRQTLMRLEKGNDKILEELRIEYGRRNKED